NGIGIITAAYVKEPTDPSWKNDKGMKEYRTWVAKYFPSGNPEDDFDVYGYSLAQTMVQVLKQCGNNLSRANIMKQAAHLNMTLPLVLPGIKVHTSPTDYHPITQEQLARFNGKTWKRFGKVISGASGM
ncbi:MAG: hypothetical protein ACREE3_11845, partial [Stellaceae bacterium]